MATLLPLTADKCDIPVTSMSSVRSSGVWLVSPMTSAGTSPRASGGRPDVASRRRLRMTSVAVRTGERDPISGGPRGRSCATKGSPARAGARVPTSRTRSRHDTERQAGSCVRTRTGAAVARTSPRAVTSVRRSRRITVPSSRPAARRTTGSVSTVASALMAARRWASPSTPPARERASCAAAAVRHAPVVRPLSAASPARRASAGREGRRRSSPTAMRPASSALPMRAPCEAPNPQTVAAQATSAGTSRRRSTRSLSGPGGLTR